MRHLLFAGALALAAAACGNQGDGANQAAPATNTAGANKPSGTIAAGLGNSRLAAAVQAAGLKDTLEGAGPYTVLAPTDRALAKLPPGRLDALLKPEGKEQLTVLLTRHILPGTMLTADIEKAIATGGGKAVLASMAGGTITATREGGRVVLTAADGSKATMAGAEQPYGNGVVHPIDTVLAKPG
jgi:uncharacterized surface protein with fasciclin (FAS1) repeats